MTENTSLPPTAQSPVQAPATNLPAITPQITSLHKECPPECNGCVKGGLPVPKELTTLFLILSLVALTIVGVLLINAKRDILEIERQSTTMVEPITSVTPEYVMPAIPVYTAKIALPTPQTSGGVGLKGVLQERRSRRAFSDVPVTLNQLGQMLWSAQGVTDPTTGKRIAPSAREVYPYTVYVVVRSTSGVEPGLYAYIPDEHALGRLPLAEAGEALTASGVQESAQQAPVVFILSASLAKSAEKMGANAVNSTMLEGGHIGQNMYLQAEDLGMALVVMAGFTPAKVQQGLQLDPGETPVYVIPFGHRGVEPTETE